MCSLFEKCDSELHKVLVHYSHFPQTKGHMTQLTVTFFWLKEHKAQFTVPSLRPGSTRQSSQSHHSDQGAQGRFHSPITQTMEHKAEFTVQSLRPWNTRPSSLSHHSDHGAQGPVHSPITQTKEHMSQFTVPFFWLKEHKAQFTVTSLRPGSTWPSSQSHHSDQGAQGPVHSHITQIRVHSHIRPKNSVPSLHVQSSSSRPRNIQPE